MDSIQNMMDPIQNTIDSIQNTMDSIQNMMDSIWNTMDSIQNTMDSIQNTIDSIQNTMASIENMMDSIQNTIDSIQNTIDSIQNTMDSIQNTMDSIQNMIDSIQNCANVVNSSPQNSCYHLKCLLAVCEIPSSTSFSTSGNISVGQQSRSADEDSRGLRRVSGNWPKHLAPSQLSICPGACIFPITFNTCRLTLNIITSYKWVYTRLQPLEISCTKPPGKIESISEWCKENRLLLGSKTRGKNLADPVTG
ncbi:hypothetical protein J6590_031420 [Homalodisca vitripennis]|nr:hypothetical protein J6590_031420 [Homalodisca vitripennis]